MFKVPNEYRIKNHPLLGSDDSDGNCGAFLIPNQTEGGYGEFVVIASDGYGWEHISARLVCENQSLTPDWDEMCYLKSIFWDDDDEHVAVISILSTIDSNEESSYPYQIENGTWYAHFTPFVSEEHYRNFLNGNV